MCNYVTCNCFYKLHFLHLLYTLRLVKYNTHWCRAGLRELRYSVADRNKEPKEQYPTLTGTRRNVNHDDNDIDNVDENDLTFTTRQNVLTVTFDAYQDYPADTPKFLNKPQCVSHVADIRQCTGK